MTDNQQGAWYLLRERLQRPSLGQRARRALRRTRYWIGQAMRRLSVRVEPR